jgi:hypothetical protein
MKKVVRLTENDIEKLVQKIIKEEGEEKIEHLKTSKGELSTIDNIISVMNQAKSSFEDLCKQVTGSDGYSGEIDGILKDFGKLEQKLRDSKQTVGKFIQQQTQKVQKPKMDEKRRMMYMAQEKSKMEGKNYHYNR